MISPKGIVKKIFSYAKDVAEEARKVTWPSQKTTVRYSILVVAVSLSVAVLFGVLDFLFNLGLEGLISISG